MAFSKSKRFGNNCIGPVPSPPPTDAHDSKHPFGFDVINISKGNKVPTNSTTNHLLPTQEPMMTQSHSSSSVGFEDSATTSKSVQVKKDHTKCNKIIANLKKDLNKITMEKQRLLRRINHRIHDATHNEHKENKEHEPAQQAQADEGDHVGEMLLLHTTIQELRSKLESVMHLEAEKSTLEKERDSALADLELKEIEVSRVFSQIEELKSVSKKEETLRYELEATLKLATDDKKEMELEISELSLKLENREQLNQQILNDNKELRKQLESALATLAFAGLDPAGLDPAGLDPAGLDPAGLAPAGLDLAGLAPAGSAPAGSASEDSAGLVNAAKAPAAKAPVAKAPAAKAPVAKAPVAKAPDAATIAVKNVVNRKGCRCKKGMCLK